MPSYYKNVTKNSVFRLIAPLYCILFLKRTVSYLVLRCCQQPIIVKSLGQGSRELQEYPAMHHIIARWIALNRNRGESYGVALVVSAYVSSMHGIVGNPSRCVLRQPR